MKIRNRSIIRACARVVAATSRLLFWTCRKQIIEDAEGVSPYEAGQEKYLYCVWHDNILGAMFSGRATQMAALTSRHADGEYVAEMMQAVGIQPIRGSSGRAGASAVKQMMETAESYDITITPDGPRGPRREVKQGIVYLASQSGRQIIPVAFAAKSAWRPKGKWTDLVIPKPFTTCVAIGGEPFTIPGDLSRDELTPYLQELQRRMDTLQRRADQMIGLVNPNDESVETVPGSERRAA